ncbi:MAG: ADP-ribosylglycohydrolase family protein [Bdellovibrio sp.]|nr:ADP-ribosylglycohydrolase family protein [Bdellovibrio sp.]
MISYQDRVLAMLWGLHAGDSLGAPFEFLPPQPAWNTQTEIVGGGQFSWKPGEATDDTDLMLCVLRSLQNFRHISFDILKKEMLAWFASKPPDIGLTTVRGLRNLAAGVPLKECGWVNNNPRGQGNGSLMRVAPLALLDDVAVGTYGTEKIYGLREIITTQAKMTHGHQYCVDCDMVLVPVVKALLNRASKEQAFALALRMAGQESPLIYERLKNLLNLKWEELPTSGFCVDTLCAALWAFIKYDSFENAVTAVINRGDDSDSCGAVAGVLCGAYYGTQAIPVRWLAKLEFRDEIQQQVAAFFGQN